ncbi:MAG: energy transducer TonB [Flavobacteriales bacterium]
MTKDFTCLTCNVELSVALEKAHSDVFIAACPQCNQRYRIAKAASANHVHSSSPSSPWNKSFSCHGCRTDLIVDLRKGPADVFIAACPNCHQRYRLSKIHPSVQHQDLIPHSLSGRKEFGCQNCHAMLTVDLTKSPAGVFIAACPQCGQRYKLQNAIPPDEVVRGTHSEPGVPGSGVLTIPSAQPNPPVEDAPSRSNKPIKRIAVFAGSFVLLGACIYGGNELSKRHTLTPTERAQAEGWFSSLQGKSWVLLTDADAEIPEQELDIIKPSVHADKYGKVTIGIALDLSAYSSDFGLGRFTATVERNHDDLAEPKELELTGPAPNDQKLTWRIISPDSMVLSIRNADAGAWGEYIAMPLDRFSALVASRKKSEQQMLLAEVDKLLAGGGLLRRGIFQSYACGDECVASFLITTNGQPVPASYVCNNNRFGELQLSQGNMIGEGDFTNQALVGRSFLFVTQRSVVDTEAGDKAALEVVTGMLPMPDEITPELLQRLAVASNVDVLTSAQGNAAAPIVPASQFLSDGEVYDLNAVQEQPSFPGGMERMYEYMGRTQKYPDAEYEAGIQGKVTVQFTVDKDGSIREVKLLRGVSEGLDQEALRIVRSMPKWIPGKLDGRPVKCRFNLPIMFRLK